jgi:predicted RNase H-like HicB family nuclease
MKTYIFRIELEEEEDGRWSAGIPALPGCASWGDTRDEALRNLRDAAEAYVRDMEKAGEEVPQEATMEVIREPVVAVTL